RHMPTGDTKKESIHLEDMAVVNDEWKDEALALKWENIRNLRAEVTKALEEARTAKLIGHPLDAALEILLPDSELKGQVENLTENLNDIFIVSSAILVDNMDNVDGDVYQGKEIEGLTIRVKKATGEKCERCWRFDTGIGEDSEHPTVCPRCAAALKKIL
ncbi:MAG: isoleucine--tRNA ligase, partial [Desulfobacteraceae bacterium]|nr:isoleucine--tRNA ligase [Desulfobacteraceae bacterium]